MIGLICMELNFYSRKLSLLIELKECRSELQIRNYKEKSFPLYIHLVLLILRSYLKVKNNININLTPLSLVARLDGTGISDSSTGIPFLHHMLMQFSSHGFFDMHVRATVDIHIDDQSH
ncbi:hypothetical protein NC653_029091 [Populus alba x Populus x berolinensis]|uniref:Uncharacterized protein n=1 Tax=Populus alba x Populus x berolinensis TaxID=444605 RepID=A0AAD6Q415_9ROSI|nr:hypothetical protein NC653_029091 [Populus alba x Populus x berolinensis]